MRYTSTRQMSFLFTTIGLAFCSTAFGQKLQNQTFLVDDHQNLVTVTDGNAVQLFSHLVTTPTVKILVTMMNSSPDRLAILDASGKSLWSKRLDPKLSFTVTGGWQAKTPAVPTPPPAGNSPASPQQLARKDADEEEIKEIGYVIGADDEPVSVELDTNKHRNLIDISSGGFLGEIDGKRFGFQLDTTKRNGTVFINGKQYPFHEVKRGEKTYNDINLNGQHILVSNGTQWQFNLDGEMLIDVLPDTGAATKAASR